MKFHTEEKNYRCDRGANLLGEGCDFECTTKDTMRDHKKKHTRPVLNPKGMEQIYQLNKTWFGEPDNSITHWRFQKTFEDCKNPKTGYILQYDFGVQSRVYGWVLVEYDTSCKSEKRQEEFQLKKEYANSHGYPLLRIDTTNGVDKALRTFYDANGIVVG
jgi:hypothetical protein